MATKAAELYEEDFYAWTRDQAAALRRMAKDRWNGPLDLEHLAEEIEDVGSERRDAVRSQVRRIIEHLLKLEHSRARRSAGRLAEFDPRCPRRDRRQADRHACGASVEASCHACTARGSCQGGQRACRPTASATRREACRSSAPIVFDDCWTDDWYPANRHGIADDTA